MLTNPLRPKLSGILSGFTKAQSQLSVFLKKNEETIKKERLELEVKEREQEKAQAVLKNIEEFLSEKPNAESVSD